MKIHVEEEFTNPNVNLLLSVLDNEEFKLLCAQIGAKKGYNFVREYFTVDTRADQFVMSANELATIASFSANPIQSYLSLYVTFFDNIYNLDEFFGDVNSRVGGHFTTISEECQDELLAYFKNRDFHQSGLSVLISSLFDNLFSFADENDDYNGESFSLTKEQMSEVLEDTLVDSLTTYVDEFLTDYLLKEFAPYYDMKSIHTLKFLEVVYDYLDKPESGTFEGCLDYINSNKATFLK